MVISRDPGSFRDPDSAIYLQEDLVYRTFTPTGAADYQAFHQSGLLDSLIRDGTVIPSSIVPPERTRELGEPFKNAALVTQHPRVPFISYPYEWSFQMLKGAALLHLKVLKRVLTQDFTVKDATPYNVQFIGSRPVFIDIGSFEARPQNTAWSAYAQFCRMFLNPLLLTSITGVPFQPWMRGSLEGIQPAQMSPLLPLRTKLRWSIFTHVVMHSWLQRHFASSSAAQQLVSNRRVPQKQVLGLVAKMERCVQRLRPPRSRSLWKDYDKENSYTEEGQAEKERFVEQAVQEARPRQVWDLGCNTGRYSRIAARHAEYVVAMDSEPEVIDALYTNPGDTTAALHPLVVDLLNPSPAQGWSQAERHGLIQRGPADLVLALALVHHLAIGGNVPLPHLIRWLASVGRAAVIEFVPKSDPMVQQLLQWREDVFDQYSQDAFEHCLNQHFRTIHSMPLPGSGRVLYHVAAQ